MEIGIIGVGGVGGYFGGKLTQILPNSKNLHVYFVARGAHLLEINKNGLLLDTDEGSMTCTPTLATDAIKDLPQLDVCLVCVKGYDLDKVASQLKPKIAKNTLILPLLNGVDIYERIRSVIQDGIVLPACVYVATHIEKPGKVTQRGASCIIHFGNDPQKSYVDPQFFELFKKANIKFDWTGNPYPKIWGKFIFISSFGLVTACFNKTLGEVIQSDELSSHVKDIMAEIYTIALQKRVDLSPTIIDESFETGKKLPFEAKTSFQRDYENREKPDERDIFGGTIIRLGEQLGIKTETTKMIYKLIQENKVMK
jgi:2-dehydropantoate 2-reductase